MTGRQLGTTVVRDIARYSSTEQRVCTQTNLEYDGIGVPGSRVFYDDKLRVRDIELQLKQRFLLQAQVDGQSTTLSCDTVM